MRRRRFVPRHQATVGHEGEDLVHIAGHVRDDVDVQATGFGQKSRVCGSANELLDPQVCELFQSLSVGQALRGHSFLPRCLAILHFRYQHRVREGKAGGYSFSIQWHCYAHEKLHARLTSCNLRARERHGRITQCKPPQKV
jgi:hypothetical protein